MNDVCPSEFLKFFMHPSEEKAHVFMLNKLYAVWVSGSLSHTCERLQAQWLRDINNSVFPLKSLVKFLSGAWTTVLAL